MCLALKYHNSVKKYNDNPSFMVKLMPVTEQFPNETIINLHSLIVQENSDSNSYSMIAENFLLNTVKHYLILCNIFRYIPTEYYFKKMFLLKKVKLSSLILNLSW